MEYTVLDLETTGLVKETDEIIEIALVKLDNELNIVDTYETFIKPNGLTTGAVEIHKITYSMVENAPKLKEVIGDIQNFITGTKIIAHNGGYFDVPFLNYHTGLNILDDTIIDTYLLAKKYLTLPSNSLANVANSLGVVNPNPHRALGDTLTTANIFIKMMTDTIIGTKTIEENFNLNPYTN